MIQEDFGKDDAGMYSSDGHLKRFESSIKSLISTDLDKFRMVSLQRSGAEGLSVSRSTEAFILLLFPPKRPVKTLRSIPNFPLRE